MAEEAEERETADRGVDGGVDSDVEHDDTDTEDYPSMSPEQDETDDKRVQNGQQYPEQAKWNGEGRVDVGAAQEQIDGMSDGADQVAEDPDRLHDANSRYPARFHGSKIRAPVSRHIRATVWGGVHNDPCAREPPDVL